MTPSVSATYIGKPTASTAAPRSPPSSSATRCASPVPPGVMRRAYLPARRANPPVGGHALSGTHRRLSGSPHTPHTDPRNTGPMTDHALETLRPAALPRIRPLLPAAVVLANAAAIVWLWWPGGNVPDAHDAGELLTSLARVTGLLGAYSALLQVLLLARIPEIERLVGLDRLSIWHRWNGHACLYLI